jgi:nicotinamide-nucleotide amidase
VTESGPTAQVAELVAGLIADLATQGASLAVAESLTGGRLTAALTSVPGSSAVVRGAVVAYASSVKAEVLGVEAHLLADPGPVSEEVAGQMALGARRLLGTTYALATTGEAGPESASGQPVGTVFVAVSGPRGTRTVQLAGLASGRQAVQRAAVAAALALLRDECATAGGGSGWRSPDWGNKSERLGRSGDT